MLGQRDLRECECVLNRVYRIRLCERIGGQSPGYMCRWEGEKEETRAWMLSLSDRQSSDWREVERDLKLNMREMGDWTVLAYSCTCIRQQRQAQRRKE
jgi:hypothetical protein